MSLITPDKLTVSMSLTRMLSMQVPLFSLMLCVAKDISGKKPFERKTSSKFWIAVSSRLKRSKLKSPMIIDVAFFGNCSISDENSSKNISSLPFGDRYIVPIFISLPLLFMVKKSDSIFGDARLNFSFSIALNASCTYNAMPVPFDFSCIFSP